MKWYVIWDADMGEYQITNYVDESDADNVYAGPFDDYDDAFYAARTANDDDDDGDGW